MDSSPRRWVLKPLSPLLQPSDLRTIAGPARVEGPDLDHHVFNFLTNNPVVTGSSQKDVRSEDVLVQAQQVLVSQDEGSSSDEWRPSSRSSSSSGSQSGFYSFVEDPESEEAELNEAWMVSSRRQTQLLTLKEERGFRLQTYSNNRKPESLFPENREDSRYQVEAENGLTAVGEEEEKQLRMEIIRNQAPKKNPMITDQLQVLKNLDLRKSTDKLLEGFSVNYRTTSSRPEPPQPSESISKEPIDFKATRQQFLKMEKESLKSVTTSMRSSRTSMSSFQQDPTGSSSRLVETLHRAAVSYDPTPWKPSGEDETDSHDKNLRDEPEESLSRQSSVFDDLDSGLDEQLLEVGGGDTSEEDVLSNDARQNNGHCESSAEHETPIEREIRLVQEREETLRRVRGLTHSDSRKEMVEIRTKRLNSVLSPVIAQEKIDMTSFTSQLETQTSKEPQPHGDVLQERENKDSKSDQQDKDRKTDRSPSEDTGCLLSPCCPHRHSEETELSITKMNLSSFRHLDSDQRTSSSLYFSPSLSPRDESAFPSWRENRETTGLQSRGQGPPDFIEKEIEDALRREEELRESRRRTTQQVFSPTPLVEQATKMAVGQFYPPSTTDKPVALNSSSPRPFIRLPSASFVTAQPWSSSSSTTARPTSSPSTPVGALPFRGLTETLIQDFEERRMRMKLEENSYAGILLIDDVNNQVIESTRVSRHKNKRALLWEAGDFANQQCAPDSTQEV